LLSFVRQDEPASNIAAVRPLTELCESHIMEATTEDGDCELAHFKEEAGMTFGTDQLEGGDRIDATELREVLPYARMKPIAEAKSQEYASAQPYPHIVLDDFFDPWVLEKVLAEFPNPRDKNWELHDLPQEIKLQSKHERSIPLFTRQFLQALNSASFLTFLEDLTGIKKLIGDPQLEGGGLHQITSGGKLAIHADFNKHMYYGLDRRLNLLIYLNKNWKDEYGGQFELWNREMTRMVKSVAPLFNRVVVFSTSEYSYHGHPEPLRCPSSMTRKSLALYYYTPGEIVDQSQTGRHSTLFQKRPGERFKLSGRQLARDLTPPLLWRAASRAFGGSYRE
jgi:Rps23 Pro-64 3,4-dihydroxylase Tpa1-like proline 4-hydroxylase